MDLIDVDATHYSKENEKAASFGRLLVIWRHFSLRSFWDTKWWYLARLFFQDSKSEPDVSLKLWMWMPDEIFTVGKRGLIIESWSVPPAKGQEEEQKPAKKP